MSECLIGLGSNQGDRTAILEAAVARLAAHRQIGIVAVSMWRETTPVGGPPGQPPFLNGALRLQTTIDPHELLALLQQIESELGRQPGQRWGPRTIDLDLLLYDELVLKTPSLVIPHPRMAWRRFVLEPAAEVAGEMLHPTIRWTLARLLQHLNSARPYVAVTGPIAAGKTQLTRRLAAAIPARLIVETPSWRRLDAFYADPAGRALQMELEFLGQRARLLDPAATVRSETEKGNSPHLPERPGGCFVPMGTVPFSRWVVSDFWFDQSAAFARAWLPEEQLSAFLEHYEQMRGVAVQPKLIVSLDAPAERLLARVRRRGRRCERHLTREHLDRIRRAVAEQVSRPGLGPVLQLSDEDPRAVFAEVLAAVQGMD